MDTVVTVIMAVLLIVTTFSVWRLQDRLAELRLDMAELLANADETHSLIVGLALESDEDTPAPVVYGTGHDEYTWTEVRRA